MKVFTKSLLLAPRRKSNRVAIVVEFESAINIKF